MMKKSLSIMMILLAASANSFAQALPPARIVSPSASEILYSLGKEAIALRTRVRDIANGAEPTITRDNLYAGQFKIKVTKDHGSILERKVHIELVAVTDADGFTLNPTNNWLAKALIGAAPQYGFADFVYPTDPAAMTGWTVTEWRASPQVTRPRATITNVIDKCTQAKNDKTRMFWFEVLPLHVHCRYISLPNLNAFDEMINMTSESATAAKVMPAADYEAIKSKIAVEVAVGAILLEVQQYIESKSGTNPGLASDAPAFSSASMFLKNKAHCFPVDSKPFVKTVLGSFVMPLAQTESTVGGVTSTVIKVKAPQEMAHPEPSYAIGAYARYDVNDDDHNRNMVANNFVTKDPTAPVDATATAATYDSFIDSYSTSSTTTVSGSKLAKAAMTVNNKTMKQFTFNGQGILHFKFNVRDVHGSSSSPSCQWFCSQPPPRAPMTPLPPVGS